MDYLAYFLIGFGIGYLSVRRFSSNTNTKLDYMKHDLAVRKEWFRMLADQKTKKSKWPEGWN